MKAMILAAGRGARLSPLTDSTPKPLLLVRGRTLIDWQLDKLSAAGFTEFVINVGYLGEKIQRHFDHNPRQGIKIDFSVEPETALETGGGIVKALSLLGNRPFALVNADVWTDFDYHRLRRVTAASYKKTWRGHLVLVKNPLHNTAGDFGFHNGWVTTANVDKNMAATSGIKRQSYTFAGISVLDHGLFQELTPGRFPLAPILIDAAAKNMLSGEIHANHWSDIGTRERLKEINSTNIPSQGGTKV